MKRFFSSIILAAISIALITGTSAAYKTAHTYLNGKVESISGNLIVIEGTTFEIAPKCRVVAITEKNGAYFEDPASLKDVGRGGWVTVKQTGKIISEIMIERWRR